MGWWGGGRVTRAQRGLYLGYISATSRLHLGGSRLGEKQPRPVLEGRGGAQRRVPEGGPARRRTAKEGGG